MFSGSYNKAGPRPSPGRRVVTRSSYLIKFKNKKYGEISLISRKRPGQKEEKHVVNTSFLVFPEGYTLACDTSSLPGSISPTATATQPWP